MTLKEMRLKRIDSLNEKLKNKYQSMKINGTMAFVLNDGQICRLDSIGDCNAIVIEYAENYEEAQKGLFGEDGDLFYMDEMDEEQMYNTMIKEIEG